MGYCRKSNRKGQGQTMATIYVLNSSNEVVTHSVVKYVSWNNGYVVWEDANDKRHIEFVGGQRIHLAKEQVNFKRAENFIDLDVSK
jgi:hypothetical protein